jgi:hypothetical protein
MEDNHRRLMEAREGRKDLRKRNWMIAVINSLNVKVHDNIAFAWYSRNSITIMYVYNNIGDPEVKKSKLVISTGCAAAAEEIVPGRF